MRRRVIATLCVMVLGLGLFPARADAFWWDWLDDLSGPSFKGVTFNWRVWCQTDDDATRRGARGPRRMGVRATGDDARTLSRQLPGISPEEMSARATLLALARQFEALLQVESERGATLDGGGGLAQARRDAIQMLAKRATEGALTPELKQDRLEALASQLNVMLVLLTEPQRGYHTESVEVGIGASLCDESDSAETRRFVSANVGWGYSKPKRGLLTLWPNSRTDVYREARMAQLGASFHNVVTRYLTVGAGGGVAFFSSETVPTFQKVYVEPYIIDVKPFLLRKPKADSAQSERIGAILAKTVSLRYSTLMFPTGFEPGRFQLESGADSERLPAELVHAVGVHIDLVPLIKHLRRKEQG